MLPRALCLALLSLALAAAAVTDVHVTERTDVEQGRAFGRAGAYERITGTVLFAVDPALPANQLVKDLQYAPRNAAGKVEFSADFYILKPRDPAKGNGTLLFEVSNRGGKGLVFHFDLAAGGRNPGTVAGDLGDAYLLEQGYTLAWVGWQFDTPVGPDILHLFAPIARNADGSPIRGKVRADFVLDAPARSASLADMGHRPYTAADPDELGAVLTVRDHIEDTRRPLPRTAWRFARDENGSVRADPGSVYIAEGFVPGKIYEVIYTAQDPPVVGLGPAAVRDFIAFLKHGGPETLLGDQRHFLKRALGYGISQSARFLRDFLYEGFNADEQGKIVFDGVWAHVGGAGRGNFNYRFAQPSRDARPFLNFFYPVDIFPFTDLPETDAQVTAGLLDRARAAGVAPKIFYSNGSYEYWGRAAALIHVTPDGEHDAPLATDTRIYYIAGAQHAPGRLPPARTTTANLSNPEDYRFALRALLEDFQAWLKDGTPPPASRFPLRATGELVPVADLHFPAIPGAHTPAAPHRAYRVDYGPDFAQGMLREPPAVGAPFPLLVPQVNADGNEISCIHLPETQVPLGTYTGWNFRTEQMGAATEMASFIGSWFPFARTKQERLKALDPRPSIEERYASRDAYLQRSDAAARSLVSQRLLLERDIPAVAARASQQWQTSVLQ